ncbi:hypothetical protein ACM26V_00395 [Salipaludibacillus sp. HK11]|uniref:hypothetical protein n=1 Tax=Salipaludibacillus sp. HK11 TaxID=3394320 RepID=UPI0039FC0A04
MPKRAVYEEELEKLTKIFEEVEDSKRKMVEGLIEDAAFLKSENKILKDSMADTGMVEINPKNPSRQRTVESAKQYLRNINSYSVVIKTLNGVLNKNTIEDEDDLSDYE